MPSRILKITDDGEWRGHHCWTVILEDEHGRSQVSARGETEADAIADARRTFDNRRIFTDEERAALDRSSKALRRGLDG